MVTIFGIEVNDLDKTEIIKLIVDFFSNIENALLVILTFMH